MTERRGYNAGPKTRGENGGGMTASGLSAGEALVGVGLAAMQFLAKDRNGNSTIPNFGFREVYGTGALVLVGLGILMIMLPLSGAGRPDERAPPTAMM